jgi:anti-sigma-K factor RskA
MSVEDANPHGKDGDDLLAAEYVLGVLEGDERTAAAARIDTEPGFARLVDEWEVRLAPLGDAFAPIEPSAAVKPAIDRRLFAASKAATSSPGFWASLAFWRGMTAAALAALLVAILLPVFAPQPPEVAPPRYVASLAADGSPVRYLAVYEPDHGDVSLHHVSGDREPGHDFELWMIEDGGAPVSMGVIPVGAAVAVPVDIANRVRLGQGVSLAITLEPAGGSPSGQPTGPVVSSGNLLQI